MPEGVVLTDDYLAKARHDIERANGIEDDCYDAAQRVVDAAPDLIAGCEQVPVLLAEVRQLREAPRDIEQVCWGRDGMVSGLRARIITRCRDALGGDPS